MDPVVAGAVATLLSAISTAILLLAAAWARRLDSETHHHRDEGDE